MWHIDGKVLLSRTIINYRKYSYFRFVPVRLSTRFGLTNYWRGQYSRQILTVQLSRKWCSHLGFSIKGSNGHTFVAAIYADSIAGKDGRLHVGDELIMVNNESIRNMETAEVIDLMRKARGIITIALLRKPSGDDEQS